MTESKMSKEKAMLNIILDYSEYSTIQGIARPDYCIIKNIYFKIVLKNLSLI
jgi:hypothetical protein